MEKSGEPRVHRLRFALIVTDLGEAGLEDMDGIVKEGVASFKLFMAYPDV